VLSLLKRTVLKTGRRARRQEKHLPPQVRTALIIDLILVLIDDLMTLMARHPPIADEIPIFHHPETRNVKIDTENDVNAPPAIVAFLRHIENPPDHEVIPNLLFHQIVRIVRGISRMDIFINRGVIGLKRIRRMIRGMIGRMANRRVRRNVDSIPLIKLIYLMLRDSMDLDVYSPSKQENTHTQPPWLGANSSFLVFHHDGPFDACRPHRNKHSHKAPVAAFPADSLTNTLAGGLGEVVGLDRDKYFGLAPREAFEDYGHVGANAPKKASTVPPKLRRTSNPESTTLPVRSLPEAEDDKIRPSVGVPSTSFDPRLKTELVHGVESVGLGTSTFLEGAPAPKSAIEKAAAVGDDDVDGALLRKKSLVQKIKARRATSAGDRSPPPPPVMAGPLLPSTTAAASTSGTTGATAPLDAAYNPVFKEGQFIERVESLPTPSSPSARERADSGGSEKAGNPGGLLGRVKSLKISGGRKGRKSEE
jgi:hypothetical protein